MEIRKSLLLHLDSLDVIDELSDKENSDLLKAIRDYNLGKEVNLTGLMKAIFIPFKNQFDRDLEKYKNICERNSLNGANGGRPKGTQITQSVISKPKKAYNDNDNDNDNDNKNKNDNKKKNKYGEFGNVLLTSNEYTNLINDYGEKVIFEYIQKVGDYIETSGKIYKSHRGAITTFLRRDKIIKQTEKKDVKDMNHDELLDYAKTFKNSGLFLQHMKTIKNTLKPEQIEYVREIDKFLLKQERENRELTY